MSDLFESCKITVFHFGSNLSILWVTEEAYVAETAVWPIPFSH